MGVEWLRPSALGALVLLAIPVAIHLVARTPVERVIVPSLRVIERDVVRLRRRRHLRDPWLLAVRLYIVAAAVVAAAGPLVTTPARTAAWARRTSRAIVVDRGLPESARDPVAAIVAAEADGVMVAERFAADPVDAAVPLALAWLAHQAPARREIVFVGDGASLPATAVVAAIPAGTGIRVRAVDGVAERSAPRHWLGSDPAGRLRGRRVVTTRAGDDARGTSVDEDPPPLPVTVRASGRDQPLLDAVWDGVVAEGTFLRPPATWLELDIEWTTALASPGRATTPLAPADRAALWPLVRALAGGEPSPAQIAPWTSLASEVAAARQGAAIAIRVARPAEPVHAATVLRAVLLVAAGDADLPRRARQADEPARRAVERPAGDVPDDAPRTAGSSDARWLWAAALLGMVTEHALRRRRQARSTGPDVAATGGAAP